MFSETDVSAGMDIDGPVHAVAHFASAASPPDYQRLPLETLAVGSRGTENALCLAERKGARFALASTSEIYGDPPFTRRPKSTGEMSTPSGRGASTTKPSDFPRP